MFKYALAVLCGLGLALLPSAKIADATDTLPAEPPVLVSIGTGGITGVYYPTGVAIAKILNERQAQHGLKIIAEPTGASVFNINAIMAGDFAFGITQADRQYQAYHGKGEWEGRPQTDLRSVFALAPELITFVAAEDSGIRTLADVKGKIISIGNPGSGNLQNALDVLEAAGLLPDRDFIAENIKAADAPRKVQTRQIDGFFYTVAHPNGNIMEATAGQRRTRIVPIPLQNALTERAPFYSVSEINMRHYPAASNAKEGKVLTVGMPSTLVTSAKVPEAVVYNLTKAVFENLAEFRSLHPALSPLTPPFMLTGMSAPVHPGALRYYKEAGLVR